MPCVLLFMAGVVIGKSWPKIREVVAPVMDDAAERFDNLYSHAARTVAQKVEDVEDRMAERRYRADAEETA